MNAEPRWLTPAEQMAWRALVHGAHELLAALDRAWGAGRDLSLEECRILELLCECDTQRVSDLARGALTSRSTVSRQVSRLVERGDAERVFTLTDRRNRLIRISDSGRRRLHAAADDHGRLIHVLFDQLTTDQVDEVARIFTVIRSNASAIRVSTRTTSPNNA